MTTLALLAQAEGTLLIDYMWLHGLASYFIKHGSEMDAPNRREIARRLRRIATVLERTTHTKEDKYEGPKCQWCGDPMHKGTCPTVSAMEFDTTRGWQVIKRVEFHDQRQVTQNMSPEVVVATKKQE